MKRILGAAFILGVLIALAGCAGLSKEQTKAYLNGIPVMTPDLSAKPDGVYEGSYTLAMPRGGIAAYHSISVAVTVKAGHIDSIAVTKPKQLSRENSTTLMSQGRLESSRSKRSTSMQYPARATP